MKASETKFEDFLSQSKINFIIPVYQRNYDWNENQCKDFIKDIESLAKRERDSHFLGTIVYIKSDDYQSLEEDITEYIIIDGQQRITTTMLFLKAIYDLISDLDDKEEILDEYLTIKRKNKLKLKPIKDDNEIFVKLMNNIEIDENCNSKIYQNYKFFRDYLSNTTLEISKYYKTFRRIFIVYIELDRGKDDPQLIFESINSTGLSLSQGDLIRNFILMDKKHEEQSYLFENYWSKIEKNLLSENISTYIRDYLTMKESKIPNQKDVYIAFKNYVKRNQIETEELLADLLYYSEIYSQFLFLKNDDKDIKKYLKDFKDLKVTVSYPFLLKLFDDYNQKIIEEEDLIKSLALIRNYVFRRLICNYATNALNKIFMTLHKELIHIKDYKSNYYDILALILTEKKLSGTYPKDSEFREYFISKDIYKFKNIKYLLFKMESFNNKEIVPSADLTIEHIMPQKLTTKWNIELGDKFNQVHEKYLHNIGNLTLSGYNSDLSNKSFLDKKILLKDSGLKLNRYFDECATWNKEEIEKRACFLFENIALNIWKYPTIENKQLLDTKQEYYILDDNLDATGTKINKLVVLDTEIKVSSWINSFVEFSKIMYELDKTLFEEFTSDEDFQGKERRIISSTSSNVRRPLKLIENKEIYLESNLSANAILTYIKLIAEKYDLNSDDVLIYIT